MSRPTSPFQFVVSDLLRRAGERRIEAISTRVDWAVELGRVAPDEPFGATVQMESASGGVFATGTVSAIAEYTCHRCNEIWREALEVPFAEMIGAGEDVEYPLAGNVADLETPLRDTVLLALPLLPICRPDCLGLCSDCGADLNTGACPGHDDDSSSPFAGLRELLEP